MNIAIVVAEFNSEITSKMLDLAIEKADVLKMNVKYISKVPGVFDMPLLIDTLLQKKDVDAVVTLGAVIRGQTKHDELISHVTAKALADLSIKHQKPVTLGITGPGMSDRQAHQRIRPVSERAIEAAKKLSEELEKIRK
ncbi:MAG: 6,7-dimethyl-8-ribityllumazine synthase [Thaumarchaeota archaeon]|nr:6,7-dimethyl-8-ribityllumazine synthase [Nitrososphaerota archaeon]MDE1830955.1 6,7-dimethyl-8-ribityllumazine synthase [Nitrososphaerota archaeon]MDE1841357.1 6,7-dimethyl-8-ribityllumazine synthase [Nitrososphaerota archaeon]MDE1877805.1 6,7-dimethyl-8-ribityllumazine synthase [Nitrososphaerota archaeon]